MVVFVIVLAGVLDFIANWLAATFLIPVGPFLIPAGTLVFALSFTAYDFLRRQAGIQPAVAAMLLGFGSSLLYAHVLGGGVGRIAVAGLIAMVFSGSTDLITQTFTIRWAIWKYILTSNSISLLIDTLVFTLIAFSGKPALVLLSIVAGQYLAKLLSTGISIPLVYRVRHMFPSSSVVFAV